MELSGTDLRSRDENYHYEYFRVVAFDLNTGQSKILLMAGGGYRAAVTGAELLATHTAKPKTVIMATSDFKQSEYRQETGMHVNTHGANSGWTLNLYEVDTRTGDGKLVEQGSAQTVGWVVDKDGSAVARADWEPLSRVYRILAKSGMGWREILHRRTQDLRNRRHLSDGCRLTCGR